MRPLVRLLTALLVIGCSGCLLLSVATTKQELLRSDDLKTRTSSRPANVEGTQCYVDQQVRELHKAHVDGLWGAGGALVAILGLIGGAVTSPIGAVIIIDGGLSFGYLAARQSHESTEVRWKPTLETEYCSVGAAKHDDKKKSGADKYALAPSRGPATRDTDGDSLADDVDQCTLGPEDKDGFADDDGCPDDDNDRDGIADASDKCPNEAEDTDGFADDDGCPEWDNDNDGVADSVDRCPLQAEDKDGWNDSDGCPDPDNDSDGILDVADKCPDRAEDKDGFADDDGCPDLDDDADGVADVDDKCPGKLETKNGYRDADGCPDELPSRVKAIVGEQKGFVFAREGQLAPTANAQVARIASVLAAEPELTLQVDAYCDASCVDVGSAIGDFVALSQRRADAVKAALVKRGVDVARLRAVGFGAPAEGTKARVEIELVSAITPGTSGGAK